MKKIIMALILAFVLLVAFVPLSNAEMAKEGLLSGTNTYAGTYKVIALDKKNYVFTYENRGVRVSDSREGPFHGMSTHNVGVFCYENGVGRLKGYLFNLDKDGDKVVMELTEEGITLEPGPKSGTAKIIGGTGKFKGIEGNLEYTRRSMKPIEKGTFQSISRGKGTWKIVEPKK
jgi:hypothetical protein